ncbi:MULTISPECIES: 30S ribosomal protein S1 [unclassified Oceanispirochaeta]|uniref:30S ribosomal protein S1 n=1 Tax=unclassified Oceanispirochaeta TaxID=2635722 RepID=UPI000E09415B|nr:MULTISPECIES: 30S ribosomal protein S1 [unclassified Oceanispirochaeta]MBF9016008.1 30S ribosomal protein S1 [Oceanispirochaeta sp. M2]NPD72471.1 30S ribosomal protein S1 [Oceanispirochaeta sp. M1]RDG31930.1 30S ribosomal protein S1 [Oceanispirochaeta sp. M1]
MSNDKPDAAEEDFAALFEDSYSAIESMEPGQAIETDIVSISGDSIFLQLSGKSEGVLEKEELTDKDGTLSVKEGDRIKVYFLQAKNGEMQFTTKISGNKAGQAILENAFNSGIPVEGVVEKEIKGGFAVKIGESRAFCPYSQMGQKRVENASEYVGKHMTFKIMEHSENGRNILVSNRAILEEEHKKQVEVLKKKLKEKMVIKGSVTRVQDFGAFVDLDGVQALLPISEISRSRVHDINKVITVGQEVEASIIKLDWQSERITLSMKALLSDPWDDAKNKYKADSKHSGTVVRITDFGAFVNLEPGLDGLIHISDLKTDSRDDNPEDILKQGQTLSVQINSVDVERKRISLKPVSMTEESAEYKKYLEPETDTYNPFADLLKDKAKKTKKK